MKTTPARTMRTGATPGRGPRAIRRVATVVVALALATVGSVVAPAVHAPPQATNASAASVLVNAARNVVGVQPASASVPAPTWLVNFVKSRSNQAKSVMEALGYTCLPIGVVCWREGSYDPPRWFYYGIVDTGNGPSGYVRARGWPGTTADVPVIRTFPEAWKLVIFCQTQGPWVYGRWGWTNVWDYVGHYGDAPMFVSDGFVRTGTNGFVAGDCGATNMGGNP
jgi:hypothetical protein